jgi:hypothetical protein
MGRPSRRQGPRCNDPTDNELQVKTFWNLLKRLETILEPNHGASKNIQTELATIKAELIYVKDALNATKTQQSAILNLIRLLFKAIREPENEHYAEAVRRDTARSTPSPHIPRKDL